MAKVKHDPIMIAIFEDPITFGHAKEVRDDFRIKFSLNDVDCDDCYMTARRRLIMSW